MTNPAGASSCPDISPGRRVLLLQSGFCDQVAGFRDVGYDRSLFLVLPADPSISGQERRVLGLCKKASPTGPLFFLGFSYWLLLSTSVSFLGKEEFLTQQGRRGFPWSLIFLGLPISPPA